MNKIIVTILTSIATFLFSLILARMMGKKLISQMNFFDFVIAISFGSITADIAIGLGEDTLYKVIVLVTLTMLVLLLDILHIKSFKARKLFTSEPIVLISKGEIVNQNMRKSRITINELTSMLREKDAFQLADVEFAILENDGHLSVLKKAEKQPVTPSDLHIAVADTGLVKDIIIDGALMEENLQDAGLSTKWLTAQLKAKGIHDIAEVFYAGIDASKVLYLSKRDKTKTEKHGKYGIE